MAKKRKHRSGFMSKVMGGNSLVQVDAMAYGALRQYVSNLISPVTSQIPLVGNLSDEVGMGLLNWFVAKNTSGLISDIAKKGLVIENARVGEGLIGGFGSVNGSGSGIAGYDSGFSY